MISGITFSKLNSHVKKKRSIPFVVYFGEMNLQPAEIKKRIVIAEELEDRFVAVMSLLFAMQQYDLIDWEYARINIQDSYLSVLEKHIGIDDSVKTYVQSFAYDIIKATQNHPDEPYYYSPDRATFIAENETNTVMNYKTYGEAVKDRKTLKKWVAIEDEVTRHSHRAVDGTIKKISEPFYVGDSLMMFPKDAFTFGASAEEIVNCRCSIKYFW